MGVADGVAAAWRVVGIAGVAGWVAAVWRVGWLRRGGWGGCCVAARKERLWTPAVAGVAIGVVAGVAIGRARRAIRAGKIRA